MNWFILALRNGFNFKGRARRKEFGWFMLITITLTFAIDLFSGVSAALNFAMLSQVLTYLSWIITLLLFIPQLSVTTRRLHDLGFSGWWQFWVFLIIFVVALGIGVISQYDTGSAVLSGLIASVVGSMIWLAFLLPLLFKDGQKQSNKYGESPKYPAQQLASQSTDLIV